ncbi:myosin-11 isoform X1 [Glossina fuscipes]|uniref:Myosin-11 isoform X1 n=2 Tax=Glossina fuscipes TaxID=7396 RepID=A0A9C6DS86_9MUSC|nr:myosin-11 isoform X1 [Glossina fuscipes]
MFVNLKNKIIEEVKAAQAAVSSSNSTTPSGSESTATTNTNNENFFSITEEDTPQNSPLKPMRLPGIRGKAGAQSLNNGTGAIQRARKLSNSSMASDVSFRLPAYEGAPIYHLQSDLDESGSELGDTNSSAKLDVVTKEQLFDAYRRSIDNYNKYRSRYMDLAKKYKDLERDSSKARSVLIETQEKAIRRINELREQCALEQEAKAHLEEALRVEMDDMECKMQAYQTKLKLLGENPENIAAALAARLDNGKELIDLNEERNLLDKDVAINGEDSKKKLNNLEALLEEKDQKIKELGEKFDLLRKQEDENSLLLAQTKAAIHLELENKEAQVKKLTENLKQLQNDLLAARKEEKHSGILIEELNDLKEKLRQTQLSKQELDAKIIATEHMLNQFKEKQLDKDKAIKALEDKLKLVTKENEEKLRELTNQNNQLNEIIQQYRQNEVSLAEVDNELNRTKNENDDLKRTMQEHQQKLEQMERECKDNIKLQEKANEELLAQANCKIQDLLNQLEAEKASRDSAKRKALDLKEQLENIEAKNENETKLKLEELTKELNEVQELLKVKEKELKILTKKSSKNEKYHENQIEKLQMDLQQQEQLLQTLGNEHKQKEEQGDREKQELRQQVNSILNEISQMENQMELVKQSHNELESEKHLLEEKIELMNQQNLNSNEDSLHWRELLKEVEQKLRDTESKLQAVLSEHTQLAEKNCLLEENTHRLEKLLSERQRQDASTEEALVSELRLKLETSENSLQKLNEKMSEVLDENSRLHNNQELNEHDQRTLQDKYDTLEKEKFCLDDSKKSLENDLNELKASLNEEIDKNRALTQHLQEKQNQIDNNREAGKKKLEEELILKDKLNQELVELKEQMLESYKLKEELNRFKQEEKEKELEKMGLNEKLENYKKRLEEYEKDNAELKNFIKELEELRNNVKKLNIEKKNLFQENQQKTENMNKLNKELQDFSVEAEKQKEFIKKLTEDISNLQKQNETETDEKQKLLKLINTSQEQLNDWQRKFADKMTELEKAQEKINKLHVYRSTNEQLEIECEYLNRHVKQLEAELAKHNENIKLKDSDSDELKDKLKSLQCELYVLKESQEQHELQKSEKDRELLESQKQIKSFVEQLEQVKQELQRQTDHVKYITEQDDTVKAELLQTQTKLKELENNYEQKCKELDEIKIETSDYNQKFENIRKERDALHKDLENKQVLLQDFGKFKLDLEVPQPINVIRKRSLDLSPTSSKKHNSQAEAERLRQINATLQQELEELKHKSSTEIITLQQDIEDLQTTNKQMADRIMDLERLKAGLQAQKLFGIDNKSAMEEVQMNDDNYLSITEKEALEAKLKNIMAEVQDVSNRNLFLENKCENYLILEQSNERLKLQNAKLSRQLDETLVSLQHSDGITANTEFEYLRNIMFQYLTGSANGNNATLVKVISAVLKFSPQQTQVALEKEHQRRSLRHISKYPTPTYID